jgi:predicted AlkP superfamily phosphohydrolase/phosphomutase
MERRNFLKYLAGGASMLALDWSGLPIISACASGPSRSVVILGIDGLDPVLLERFVNKGRMPAFRRLMEEGSFSPLGTSIPPQSPVAWSNFITGTGPGGHGIFDFIHRDPETYRPAFSLSRVEEPDRVIRIGNWTIPVSSGRAVLLRRGTAFWQVLDRHGVPYAVYKIPSNFPPAACKGRTLSGLGTPDLLGSYGTFSFYTNDPEFESMEVSGGTIYPVTVRGGKVSASITGPENTLKKDRPALRAPFFVYTDRERGTARISIGDRELLMAVGEWSPWVEVSFDILGSLHSLQGACRFYLKSLDPHFRLYVSPINIDPMDPALPISTPPGFSREICGRIGRFYTQGMAEDTKALEWGVLDDGEFIDQVRIVLEERRRLLDFALDGYHGGLLFFYVSTLDLGQHMLWRNMDPDHPAHTREAARYGDQIEELYMEMDRIVSRVRERIPADADLFIMSDHGFSPYYRNININTWLHENGYLELLRPEAIDGSTIFDNVHWRRTRAYALGINSLYVNLRGREKQGTVMPGAERDALVAELRERLLALKDPATGMHAIKSVYASSAVYRGPEAESAPDLVIGYNIGYRCSDNSALGSLSADVLSYNMGKWSGDHCMAAELIPGTVVTNGRLTVGDPRLTDFFATILAIYGIDEREAPAGSRPLVRP